MIIANPIYDVTFKRLLENDRTAKFLIGTILDCKVVSLEPAVIERTKYDRKNGALTLFRMDFAATIKNEAGEEKRVIIEMQKAKHLADVDRFREYLGTEYIASDLPIMSIYILGFNLSVDSAAFGNFPACRDLLTGEPLRPHDPFVEQLTHTAYFVQTKRIKPSLNTRLDKLLSIFEQAHFISEREETTKDYALSVDDPEIEAVLDILKYAAADAATRKELDDEAYYQRAMYGMFGKQYERMEKLDLEIAAAKREIEGFKRESEGFKRESEGFKRESEGFKRESEGFKRESEETMRALRQAEESIRCEEERVRKLVRKLKDAGTPITEIAELTGLSAEEIDRI